MTDGIDADRIRDLEDDNRRLRRLLDAANAPGELRHRLRSTLAMLRAAIRRSATTGRDLPAYVDHLEERLDAIVRAQATADQHGTVDLRRLLADELLQYGASDGEALALSGPDVHLQPRAGQVVALAMHELAVNAVEHGAFGAGRGTIEVRWSVEGGDDGGDAPLLVLHWSESGAPPNDRPARQGFGTEVLIRMLPFELQAETETEFAPGGLRCTIRIPMPIGVGQIAPE